MQRLQKAALSTLLVDSDIMIILWKRALGAEAVIDATLVAEGLKLATNRERPDEGNGTGGFWAHGTRTFSDSFPSGHAIGSWAVARVIASEYPNKPTQIGVYAFATAISVSRVTSGEHLPSDALVDGRRRHRATGANKLLDSSGSEL
jgi:membrane-associated phospholipid phosphatase